AGARPAGRREAGAGPRWLLQAQGTAHRRPLARRAVARRVSPGQGLPREAALGHRRERGCLCSRRFDDPPDVPGEDAVPRRADRTRAAVSPRGVRPQPDPARVPPMSVIGLLLLLAVAMAPTPAGADALSPILDGVAKRILEVKDLKGKKVGVESFPMGGGRLTELSGHLADRLDVALTGLAAPSGVEMVTRQHLCDVIRENKLWVDDRFDPSLHKKLGPLGQADFMVAGRVVSAGGQASVSVRVVDTETGRQVWADAVTVQLDRMLGELATRIVDGDGCGAASAIVAATPEPRDAPSERLDVKIWTD